MITATGETADWDAIGEFVEDTATDEDIILASEVAIDAMATLGYGPDDHGVQTLLEAGALLALDALRADGRLA